MISGEETMCRILIAENEQHLRESIVLALRIQGYEVIATDNGKDALKQIVAGIAVKAPFDAVIFDFQMPGMTGEELLINLKNRKTAMPAILVTGYGERDLLLRLMRLGCRYFIDKPFGPETLCDTLKQVLSESENPREDAERTHHLARTGKLARAKAHDLCNVIGCAIGYVDIAMENLDREHPQRKILRKILSANSRAAELCKDLLYCERTAAGRSHAMTEIYGLIGRVTAMLTDIAPENITIKSEIPARPVWLPADSERLQQALLNLGLNALQVMKNSGELVFHLAEKTIASPPLQCIELTVSDNGPGMSEEQLNHIFKHGYTNRESGHGHGLGIVQEIIEKEHNGWIEVQTGIGKGTSFKLLIPKKIDSL